MMFTNAAKSRLFISSTMTFAFFAVISKATSLGKIPVESFPSDNPDIPNPDGTLGKGMKFSKVILDRHNYYREAVKLQPFKWNNTLAKLAYMTSKHFRENDCQDKHRYEFNQKHWVGENLYHMTRIFAFYDEERDIGYHAENAVDEWYREIRYYTYPLTEGAVLRDCLPRDDFPKYVHFIQMMWQKGRQIGCSYASCFEKTDEVYEYVIPWPKIIVNCYYDTPILVGTQAFNKGVAKRLNEWPENAKYGGLKFCGTN